MTECGSCTIHTDVRARNTMELACPAILCPGFLTSSFFTLCPAAADSPPQSNLGLAHVARALSRWPAWRLAARGSRLAAGGWRFNNIWRVLRLDGSVTEEMLRYLSCKAPDGPAPQSFPDAHSGYQTHCDIYCITTVEYRHKVSLLPRVGLSVRHGN